MQRVARVINRAAAFRFSLVAARCFPDALYLEPAPAQPFVALTEALVREFPSYLPNEGRYSSVIPHLTVARGEPTELSALRDQLAVDLRLQGGVQASCEAVVLLENASGYWRQMGRFKLFAEEQRDG